MGFALSVLRSGQAAVVAAAVVLAALPSGPAAAETRIKFSLDTRFEGPSAPFLIAIDRGYFSAEGLAVTIDAADAPLEAINRLATGPYDMSFGDINSLIRFRDANAKAPIKAVFMVYNKPAFAVIGRKSRGVVKPKDLEGKRLGAPAADIAFANWKIFAQVNNIDISKVIIENVGVPVREPMLAAGQVDAITGLSFASFINMKDRGVPVDDLVVLLMADYGVNLYGNAIMVNPKFLVEHPDAVQGFLRGYLKGLRDTIRSPTAAIETVLKRNDTAKKDVELERLRMVLRDNILTPEVKTNGLGGVVIDKFDKSIEQIALTYAFKNGKPKGSDIFDDAYLPPAADRKVH